jgi:hypothetical protein
MAKNPDALGRQQRTGGQKEISRLSPSYSDLREAISIAKGYWQRRKVLYMDNAPMVFFTGRSSAPTFRGIEPLAL